MTIKEDFFEILGCYPVLHISEYLASEYRDEFSYLDLVDFYLDVEKFDQVDDFCLRYVDNILRDIGIRLLSKPDDRVFYATASLKYSFSDTPEWWDAAKIEDISDRIVLDVSCEVYP